MTSDPRPPPEPVPEPVLPGRLRLAPYRSVLPLGAGGRLLGLDPAAAVAVDELTPGLAAMLDELAKPTRTDALLATAARLGTSFESAAALLRALLQAGVIVDAGVAERRARHRGGSHVVVSGGGPLLAGLVLGLVQAGVGAVYTEASGGPVRSTDLGTGHVDADRGRERAVAVRDAVRRLRPGADAPAMPARVRPDLVLLADELAPEPARLQWLHVRAGPYLPVRMRDGIGLVGPLVVPGRTACLGCLELHRQTLAPGWPVVAAQLTGRVGQADPAATAATAALGVAQALAALDSMSSGGRQPPTWEVTLELDAAAGTIARRAWQPHPGCGCGAGTPPAPARPSEDATDEHSRGKERIMV